MTKNEHQGAPSFAAGKITGVTDTDYFYFICSVCPPHQVLRILDYRVRSTGKGGEQYPDVKPRQARDFTLEFDLLCPECDERSRVRVSNTGLQGGLLQDSLSF